ncbi:FecCD family ABC transporter permease, partial [Nocardioides pacificus]
PDVGRRGGASPTLGLLALGVVLVAVCLASLAWGTRDVAPGTVLDAVLRPDLTINDHRVVRELRLPRTLVGLLGGIALGLAGALMQGLTRNPIADPGLLGINSGASLAVIVAISVFGITGAAGFIWFAFAGAAIAALVVYGVATMGWEGPTPVKLALVGAAFTATTTSLITMVLLTDRSVLEQYRFWQVGSLVNRPLGTVAVIAPFLLAGVVLALASARFLNAMSLGEDLARGLGQHVVRGRSIVLLAVVLLCGGATALVGPIAFVGLMVPHVARFVVGPDYRWILPWSMLLGPVLLLTADIVGRLVLPHSELEAGLVVAVLGAPVLIALVRRSKGVAM